MKKLTFMLFLITITAISTRLYAPYMGGSYEHGNECTKNSDCVGEKTFCSYGYCYKSRTV